MIKLIYTPTKKVRYTSFYAPRWGTFHHGIDIGAIKNLVCGDPLYATADGVVKRVRGMHPLMGNFLVIEHNREWCDLYLHMQEFSVKTGQKVKAGEVVGYMGTTGSSTGAHLHYEIRQCPYERVYEAGMLHGFDNMPIHAIDPKPYIDDADEPPEESASELIAKRCGIEPQTIAFMRGNPIKDKLFDKLWNVIKTRRPMPDGRGNPNADMATAVARECGIDGKVITYLWKYKFAKDLFRKLWYQMQ